MSNHDNLIISWLELRRTIGFLGMIQPIVIFMGGLLIFSTPLQSSMSAYYYTGMRDVFVGLSIATGVFFLSYKGYDRHDRIASRIAGTMAIIAALLPSAPDINASGLQVKIGIIHIVSSSSFLLVCAWFSLVQFPKSDKSELTQKKRIRNKVYKSGGIVILICLAFIAVYIISAGVQEKIKPYHPIYFAELISFLAFGVAWIVKGKTILKDD